jgi:hypothetical protein
MLDAGPKLSCYLFIMCLLRLVVLLEWLVRMAGHSQTQGNEA